MCRFYTPTFIALSVPEASPRVARGRDLVAPGAILQVPSDGLGEARFERLQGLPAELALQLGAVDRVAAVVAGPVGHVGDLCGVAFTVGARCLRVEQRADAPDDVEVGPLVDAADIVGLTGATALEHRPDGGGVVLHVEPVADLLAVAVDRERLAVEGVEDDQRDEFSGKWYGP